MPSRKQHMSAFSSVCFAQARTACVLVCSTCITAASLHGCELITCSVCLMQPHPTITDSGDRLAWQPLATQLQALTHMATAEGSQKGGGRASKLSPWLKRLGADVVVSVILLILVAVVWSYVIQAGIRYRRRTATEVSLGEQLYSSRQAQAHALLLSLCCHTCTAAG
jgi:hypothetical protein